VLGTLIAIARLSPNPVLSFVASSYVNLIRSIQLILVIFWFFFLVPWIAGWVMGASRPIPVGPEYTAYITFSLFEAAYFGEIVRAVHSVDSSGQTESAWALGPDAAAGLSARDPAASVAQCVADLLTQTIILFQDTSLVYVISATDLLGAASKVAQRDGRLVEMYLAVAVIYFVVCFAASQTVKRMEHALRKA